MGHNFLQLNETEARCLNCDCRSWSAVAGLPCPPVEGNWQADPTEPPLDDH